MNRTRIFATACSASALASALVWASPGWAQQSPQPAVAPTQLGEIIVTARKRQESILNVPVVEAAIPQQKLQRFQTQDLKDIATLVPGIALGDSILSIGTQISIRGVGTTTYNPGVDQSVSLNVDGLQLTQGLAYSSAMFDMAQVEVLKGPQSLFYGKTSTGGVISIRTADPTDKFEVIARAGYEFEAQEKQGQIIVSGPITDTLKARLAAQYDQQEGFYNNVAVGVPAYGGLTPAYGTVSPDKNYMLRGTVLWNPTDQFDARLKINQTHDLTEESGAEQFVLCPEGNAPLTLAPGLSIPFMSPNDTCQRDRQTAMVDMDPAAFPGIPNGGASYIESTQSYGTLELNYRPRRDLTITSTTGYYGLHSTSLFNPSVTGAAGPILGVTNGFHRRELTEELRVNSDFAGPLNFTAGGFIERGRFNDLVTLRGNQDLSFITHFPLIVQSGNQNIDITTNSIFGQLRYKIIPQVEVAAGVRLSDEKRTDAATDYTTGVALPITLADPKIESKTASPELTITYKPTEDMTLFGSLKRGFKSGSFDTATPPTPDEDNAFGDEKVEGGELGMKSRWLERQLAFNIAGYKYRYTGLQVGAIIPVNGGVPVTRTLNAGAALVYGIESDVAYRPDWLEGLDLNASVNWNHAQFKDLNNVPCYEGQTIALGCNENFSTAVNNGLGGYTAQDESGLPLVRAPKWQTAFGFDYETDIGNNMKLVVANNTQYSSKYLTGLGYVYYQPSFFKTDLSLTLQGPKDRWEFAVIGKNLNNALTSGNCTHSDAQGGLIGTVTGTTGAGPAGLAEIGCWMDRGREVWLQVTLKPFN